MVAQKECQNAEEFPQSTFNESHQIWMRTKTYEGSWQSAQLTEGSEREIQYTIREIHSFELSPKYTKIDDSMQTSLFIFFEYSLFFRFFRIMHFSTHLFWQFLLF